MIKIFDYLGTGLSMFAYLLIINGLWSGAALGILASSCLLYVAIKTELNGLKWLQLFFIAANIYAILLMKGFI